MSTTSSLYSEDGTIVQHAPEEDESMSLSNLVIEVEDKKFRIRCNFFRDSEPNIFNSTPEYDELGADRPLRLEGIDKVDFSNFLKYVNTRRGGTNSAACRSVLKLSAKWKLAQIRAAAIRDFATVDTVQKIVLAREFFVTEWLVPALAAYACKCLSQPITMEDIQQLGTDYILKMMRLRETMYIAGFGSEIEKRRGYNFTPHLQASFAKEIKESAYQDPKDVEPLSDDDLYLIDLYFLVEDCLFKSYRQYFEVSPAFRKIFAVPVPSNEFPAGSSRSQPLHLKGIMKEDFSPFLKLANARVQEVSFPISGWISILKLSTMWDFITMRQRAIREIEQISMAHARKIYVARSCHVQKWLLPALCAYTQQKEAITAEDVDLLGWDYVLRIMRARDETAVAKTIIARRTTYDLKSNVASLFQGEVKKIAEQEKGLSSISGMDIAELE